MSFWADAEREALDRDRADPLARFRDRFHVPADTIYLDGNSLGLLSRDAEAAVARVLDQWREHVIDGYSLPRPDSWYYTGEELGSLMAPLVGADPDEIVATGTTTVNLHQLLASFFRPSGNRRRIIATDLDFPTDVYAFECHARAHGGKVVLVPSRDGRTIAEDDLIAAFDDTAALALLPSVLYRSGQLLDIARLSAAAHERGVVVGFDCSHSVGAVPHRLAADGADFAVWCGYKYLNGGPGCVAALFVARRHHSQDVGLAGWWGNDKQTQFDMVHMFRPAPDAGRWQISSNPQLAAAPLRASLAIFREAGPDRLREKSLHLTAFLMRLTDELADLGYRVGTPREDHRRGGHVAVEHPEAARICKVLKRRGVVPDYRMPNVVRLAPVALYNTFHEVWRAAALLKEIAERREFEQVPPGRNLIA